MDIVSEPTISYMSSVGVYVQFVHEDYYVAEEQLWLRGLNQNSIVILKQ